MTDQSSVVLTMFITSPFIGALFNVAHVLQLDSAM